MNERSKAQVIYLISRAEDAIAKAVFMTKEKNDSLKLGRNGIFSLSNKIFKEITLSSP